MERVYKIGTRSSPLALRQVQEAVGSLLEFYPFLKTEAVGIGTRGDKDKTTPVSQIEGSDFFTCEIDEALLKGEIDFAVHSAKDLPDELRNGLAIAAMTSSIDPYDALVSKSGLNLDRLPKGARIGTSSLRRKEQLKKYREDFEIVDIRGNIEERLRLLDFNHFNRVGGLRPPTRFTSHEQQNLDAIVIAACGLIRLGLSRKITQRIPLEILKPHPLQGSLAVVVKKDNRELLELLSVIDSQNPSDFGSRRRRLPKSDGKVG